MMSFQQKEGTYLEAEIEGGKCLVPKDLQDWGQQMAFNVLLAAPPSRALSACEEWVFRAVMCVKESRLFGWFSPVECPCLVCSALHLVKEKSNFSPQPPLGRRRNLFGPLFAANKPKLSVMNLDGMRPSIRFSTDFGMQSVSPNMHFKAWSTYNMYILGEYALSSVWKQKSILWEECVKK